MKDAILTAQRHHLRSTTHRSRLTTCWSWEMSTILLSAADVKAVRPLHTVVCSSSASISSHSSRMNRCSKLEAQTIASQPASASSSPILRSDMSLFSLSSFLESPVSIISPLMALSIFKADQEDLLQRGGSDGGFSSSMTPVTATAGQDWIQLLKPRRRGSRSTTFSTTWLQLFPRVPPPSTTNQADSLVSVKQSRRRNPW